MYLSRATKVSTVFGLIEVIDRYWEAISRFFLLEKTLGNPIKYMPVTSIRAVARPWRERQLPRAPVYRECKNSQIFF